MNPVIRAENLGKSYKISQLGRGPGYRTLRESLAGGVSAMLRRRRDRADRLNEEFWALKDLGFEVNAGEVVGIIGHNGAGKSTLLKILSKIIKPTTGQVELHGRVGSLLEVGTGFHPELTGRENVYLNGAVLGMTRREVGQKFDEIVAFAEVEKFLDTPVKRYSSGMYVRLAFAVAAHLEPEVLLVDEVLAVGDATYQRRCLDRMTQLANGGRTIILVSHNMQIIPQLCHHAILLDRGQIVASGDSRPIVEQYLGMATNGSQEGDLTGLPRSGDGRARFVKIVLVGPTDRPIVAHVSGEDIIVRMEIESGIALPNSALAVVLQNVYGMRVVTSWTKEVGYDLDLRVGRQCFECRFRAANFRPGHTIRVNLWLASDGVIDHVENAATFDVVYSEATRALSSDSQQGIVVFEQEWRQVDPEVHDRVDD